MKTWAVGPIGIALTLALLLGSVADRSGAMWLAARALGFAACMVLGWRAGAQLIYGLAGAFVLLALFGSRALDLSLACLAFTLLRLRLSHWAGLLAAIGLAGSLSFAYAQLQPGWAPLLLPFHNRNHYAVFCELALPVFFYAARRSRGRLYWAAIAILYLTALAAGSRMGAVLLSLEVCALWVATQGREKLWLAIPGLGIVASLFLFLVGRERLQNPLTGDHRLEIWNSSWQMVAAHPFVGWGLQEFTRIYPAYASFDNGEFVNAAHCDWLEWAVEMGVPFVAVCLFAFMGWLRKTIHFYPSWGILVGALHATVDYPFHLPGILVFAAALAGSIEANGTRLETQPTDRKRRNS
jgi:O-antigen ligase